MPTKVQRALKTPLHRQFLTALEGHQLKMGKFHQQEMRTRNEKL